MLKEGPFLETFIYSPKNPLFWFSVPILRILVLKIGSGSFQDDSFKPLI